MGTRERQEGMKRKGNKKQRILAVSTVDHRATILTFGLNF